MPPPPVLVFTLFPILFLGVWCLATSIISNLGWKTLSKRNTAFSPPEGTRYSWQSAAINRWGRYNNCLTFHIGKTGLRISVLPIFAIGHPALFFDWSKVRFRKDHPSLLGTRYSYDLGTPQAGRIHLSPKIHSAIQEQLLRL